MDNPEFFRGAKNAYLDCANFALKISTQLPPNLFFLKDSYVNMANSFVQKADSLDLLMAEPQGQA